MRHKLRTLLHHLYERKKKKTSKTIGLKPQENVYKNQQTHVL